jgi:hypothetical protein
MKKRRKLSLSKETLRDLQRNLGTVAGGDTYSQGAMCSDCGWCTFGCDTNACTGSYGCTWDCTQSTCNSWCAYSRYETWCAGCDTATCDSACC